MDKPSPPNPSNPASASASEFEYEAFDKAMRQLFKLLEAVYRIKMTIIKSQNKTQKPIVSPVYTSFIKYTENYYLNDSDVHKPLFNDLWTKYKVAILSGSDVWIKTSEIVLIPIGVSKEGKKRKNGKTDKVPKLNLTNFYNNALSLFEPYNVRYPKCIMATLCQIFLSLLPPIIKIKPNDGKFEMTPEEKQIEAEYACLIALAKLDPAGQAETDDLTQVSSIVNKLTSGINIKAIKAGNIKSDELVDTLCNNADGLISDMGGGKISDGIKTKLKNVTSKVTNSMGKDGSNPVSILKDVMQEFGPDLDKSPQGTAASAFISTAISSLDANKPPAKPEVKSSDDLIKL
jgi:hypothetical protein